MPIITDAVDALKQQLASECRRIQAIRLEKKKYAEAYNSYVSLQREFQERASTIDELAGLLGTDGYLEAANEDGSGVIGETFSTYTPISQLRDELPLWKAIRWYVGYAGDARINDVLVFLVEGCGITNASRNAIESALRLHPETFKSRKRKGEKFISLKGGQ